MMDVVTTTEAITNGTCDGEGKPSAKMGSSCYALSVSAGLSKACLLALAENQRPRTEKAMLSSLCRIKPSNLKFYVINPWLLFEEVYRVFHPAALQDAADEMRAWFSTCRRPSFPSTLDAESSVIDEELVLRTKSNLERVLERRSMKHPHAIARWFRDTSFISYRISSQAVLDELYRCKAVAIDENNRIQYNGTADALQVAIDDLYRCKAVAINEYMYNRIRYNATVDALQAAIDELYRCKAVAIDEHNREYNRIRHKHEGELSFMRPWKWEEPWRLRLRTVVSWKHKRWPAHQPTRRKKKHKHCLSKPGPIERLSCQAPRRPNYEKLRKIDYEYYENEKASEEFDKIRPRKSQTCGAKNYKTLPKADQQWPAFTAPVLKQKPMEECLASVDKKVRERRRHKKISKDERTESRLSALAGAQVRERRYEKKIWTKERAESLRQKTGLLRCMGAPRG